MFTCGLCNSVMFQYDVKKFSLIQFSHVCNSLLCTILACIPSLLILFQCDVYNAVGFHALEDVEGAHFAPMAIAQEIHNRNCEANIISTSPRKGQKEVMLIKHQKVVKQNVVKHNVVKVIISIS